MTLDDETLLSGYLDDELDAAERQAVELAIQADPSLADRLRELSGARELLGGLGRPRCPVDLTASVLNRIPSGVGRSAWASRRGKLVPLVVSVGAIAASTLAVVFRLPARPPADHAAGPVLAIARAGSPDPIAPSPTVVADARPEVLTVAPTAAEVSAAREAHIVATDRDAERLRELLRRPDATRVFILADALDVPRQLTEVIEGTARKSADFGRIFIQQGVVIDPDNPGEATVFAMVMDRREREQFLRRINDLRPSEPQGVRPEVLAQLNDLPDATMVAGKAAAGLDMPPREVGAMALKAHPLPPDRQVVEGGHSGGETHRGIAGRDDRADRKSDALASHDRERAPSPEVTTDQARAEGLRDPDGPGLVLVWVSKDARNDPTR